ncbi:hypothetical protein [Ideonella sp.]|uniref:hypothetical protein n=1 Tax=Ideonella sp. TaxID=1929293 RepID=UPI002B46F5D5|nr:hypothetical protein [Ideonella sp.]HJV72230.1 hypothetical protein [Ideonella sp.]
MKAKTLFGAATLALAAASSTWAADGLKPVLGVALTGGGKTLIDVEYSGGSHRKISSGGLTHVFGGIEYTEPGSAVTIQATVGYHFDRASASNGSVSFSRVPFEVLGFWNANDNWRFGGGLRKATSAQFDVSGVLKDYASDFNMRTSVGVVLQAEYLFGAHGSVFLRYVDESYKSNYLVGGEVDGNHGGLGLAWRF